MTEAAIVLGVESTTFAGDTEEAAFRTWISEGANEPTAFSDPVFSRFVDALMGVRAATDSTADLAVLLRQVLRRASERDGNEFSLRLPAGFPLGPELDWAAFGLHASETIDGAQVVGASAWRPSWLAGSDLWAVDHCSVAGTYKGVRAVWNPIPADPFFEPATGYSTYRTPGQRAAVRAALSTPPGGALVALLPTGSGKTEVALALARSVDRMTTVVVVPTIALAYDFERRFRRVFNTPTEPFAWTSETTSDQRDLLTERMVNGIQPLLVTSPESLTERIRQSLLTAAGAGRIRALVIDEAHLISQWGRAFRPQYRELAYLHQELVAAAPSLQTQPIVLLLSATLPPHELNDLYEQYSSPGPFSVVAANSLRPEHDWWVAPPCSKAERQDRVVEAALHLPRPLVLYATRPEQATEWVDLLRAKGFRRLGVVTGDTPGQDRRDVLEQLRSGDGVRSGIDLVVATSAFGLGIDYDQIRSVVHACLPETADRWYQEVGRSGRDGHAAVGLLIPWIEPGDDDDLKLARALGPKALKPETAAGRWSGLWSQRRSVLTDGTIRNFVDADSRVGIAQQGSYNLKWNRQLLQGLDELSVVRRRFVAWQDAIALGLSAPETAGDHQWVEIQLVADFPDEEFFAQKWDAWRQPILDANDTALHAVMGVARGERAVCEALSDYYTPPEALVGALRPSLNWAKPPSPCGRCPTCRLNGEAPPRRRPPSPANAWMTLEDTGDGPLRQLLERCPTNRSGRVVLVTSDESTLTQQLVDRLFALGVRWFAGCVPKGPPRSWFFADQLPARAEDQPPVPGCIVVPDSGQLDPWWFQSTLRANMFRHDQQLPPVILVSASLANEHRNLPRLNASTALTILRGVT